MAALMRTCPDCGRLGESQVGQFVADERLVWHESFHCRACGCRMEFDHSGVPETTVREAIVEQTGRWAWSAEETGLPLVRTLSSLRGSLGLTVGDVAAVKNQAPGVLAVGTTVEMRWLKTMADRHHLASKVEIADDCTAAPLKFADLSVPRMENPNLVFLGLEPLEITEADLLPVHESRLHWRWADPRHCVLPADVLSRIYALTRVAALKADRRSQRFLESDAFPSPEMFDDTETLDFADDRSKVEGWLAPRVPDEERVVLSWDRDTAVVTDAGVFRQFWDEFCYPGSDDAVIWPTSERWVLVHHHEERLLFGRRKAT